MSVKVQDLLKGAKESKASNLLEIFKQNGEVSLEDFKNTTDEGKTFRVFKSMSGKARIKFFPKCTKAEPEFLIVEKYRLSNYLGQYGAGRVIKTLSLLPGETRTISISTYKNSTQTRSSSMSILDSTSTENIEEFEDSLIEENSEGTTTTTNQGGSIGATIPVKGVDVSVEGGADRNNVDEEFSKTVESSVHKTTSVASASRDIEINDSYERTVEEGESKDIVREIKNINVGRTLNFTFRQMNQEFISILHLVDLKVAFHNGMPGSYVEVPLYELDDLLEKYVKLNKRKQVRDKIIEQLKVTVDYKGVRHQLIEEVKFKKGINSKLTGFGSGVRIDNLRDRLKLFNSYWKFKKDVFSKYKDVTGNDIAIPGVIMSLRKHTMRTDGVIVESLLGQAPALDEYSLGLQVEKVKTQELENQMRQKQVALEDLKLEILRNKDLKSAEIYQKLYGETVEEEVVEED